MMRLSMSSLTWIALLIGGSDIKMKSCSRKIRKQNKLVPVLIQLLLLRLTKNIHHQVLSISLIPKAKPLRKATSVYFSKRAIFISSNVLSSIFSQAFRPSNSMILSVIHLMIYISSYLIHNAK